MRSAREGAKRRAHQRGGGQPALSNRATLTPQVVSGIESAIAIGSGAFSDHRRFFSLKRLPLNANAAVALRLANRQHIL